MHKEQTDWCIAVKEKYPEFFKEKHVLDVGSHDVNGNNRFLFEDCWYIGVDAEDGPNVDIVESMHDLKLNMNFDCIISTECFEHDPHFEETIKAIVKALKPGGLFVMTCATDKRPKHNTKEGGHYQNIFKEDFEKIPEFNEAFKEGKWGGSATDLYFCGIKRLNE